MSLWTDVSINLKTTENTSKADIVNVYQRFSKAFKGSEGGLDISFVMKKVEKEYKNFKTFDHEVMSNAILENPLRNKGEESYNEMINCFKEFYDVLQKNNLVEGAVVVFDCHTSEEFVHVYCKRDYMKIELVKK